MRRLALCFAAMVLGCFNTPDSKGTAEGEDSRDNTDNTSTTTGGKASVNTNQNSNEDSSDAEAPKDPTVVASDFSGPLGRRCDESVTCESGLECFSANGSDFGDYGPAGGLCSLRCKTDEDCADYADAGNADAPRCVALLASVADSAICMPGCRLKDDRACGGRNDVACWAVSDSPSDGSGRVCIPLCNHDDQCPPGSVCDGLTNLCSTWSTVGGLSLGAECDPTATNDCDNGFCLDLGIDVIAGKSGLCSSYCRRGTFPQCGGNGDDTICGWVFPGDEAASQVDTGMCAVTCACNVDCSRGSYCALHPDREGMAKPGICTIGSGVGIESCE